MTGSPRYPWGLFRTPSGRLEVAFLAFADASNGTLLSKHESRPDAVLAREAIERQDELEEAWRRGQGELFDGGAA